LRVPAVGLVEHERRQLERALYAHAAGAEGAVRAFEQ
jgi:hypothetical protein